jgi:branched-chain amino acid transport system ATP-binding protein
MSTTLPVGPRAESRQPAALLTLASVSKRFGGLQALSGVSLSIERGHVHGLIGPNGAGKTTLFNLITGLYAPDEGRFELDGASYLPAPAHQIAQAGIARTFQNIRLFGAMTALENVMVGRHVRTGCDAWAAMLRTPSQRREELAIRAQSRRLLDEVGLERMADVPARTLSYGDQRRLEIARALATEPRLLALDEPAAGMNATEKRALRELLLRIQASGVTLLLIEHDVKLVMDVCNRVSVLDHGRLIAEGEPHAIRRDPLVIEAYLGAGHA